MEQNSEYSIRIVFFLSFFKMPILMFCYKIYFRQGRYTNETIVKLIKDKKTQKTKNENGKEKKKKKKIYFETKILTFDF